MKYFLEASKGSLDEKGNLALGADDGFFMTRAHLQCGALLKALREERHGLTRGPPKIPPPPWSIP